MPFTTDKVVTFNTKFWFRHSLPYPGSTPLHEGNRATIHLESSLSELNCTTLELLFMLLFYALFFVPVHAEFAI
jgi:hypothetical protein